VPTSQSSTTTPTPAMMRRKGSSSSTSTTAATIVPNISSPRITASSKLPAAAADAQGKAFAKGASGACREG
jgi:hypothetical protein